MQRFWVFAAAAALGLTPGVALAQNLDRLLSKTAEVNAITVEVTPTRADDRAVVIRVVLDTHEVDLGMNLEKKAKLTVDGATWPVAAYRGDPPGGHHREGSLRFRAKGALAGRMRLVIRGLDGASATFAWALPAP